MDKGQVSIQENDPTLDAAAAYFGADDEEERDTDSDQEASGTEDEPETESEAEEGDEQQEQEQEQEQLFTVQVNGEKLKVPLSELVAGYQKGADYTRKTQQVAEARRALEARAAEIDAQRSHYEEALTRVATVLNASTPQVDWDQLRQTDPLAFATQWAQYQQQQTRMQAVQAEMARVRQEREADERRRLAEVAAQEAQLLVQAIPEWTDRKRRQEEQSALLEYGVQQGFAREELEELIDHRAVNVLRKAWMYDQLRQRAANAPKTQTKVAPAPPAPASRATRGNQPQQSIRNPLSRLKRSGSVEDAAAVFRQLI